MAWATGLYEGEGSIVRGQRGIMLQMSMCDPEPLQRLQKIFGGSLHGPHKPRRENEHEYWHWRVANWIDVPRIYRLMKPYLSLRRIAQIEKALLNPAPNPRGANHPPGCPPQIIPSQYGYKRHYQRKEPACPTCLASFALYMRTFNAKRKRHR